MSAAGRQRIGVFGGTFDPPHAAHLELARTVLGAGAVELVLLVPCFRHAFGKEPAAFAHRVAMCGLLVEGEDGMAVSDAEARLDHPGRTLDLIAALEAERPEAELRLVAGGDIFFEREKWYRFDEVERRAPPIWVARQDGPALPVPALRAPAAVSSTAIREAIAGGRAPRELLPPGVAGYVVAHGLYGARP